MKEFITACPRNCYSTCSFRVFTENDRVVRILPFEGNLATPEGPCIKGLSYLEREYSPSRLLYPLRRTTEGNYRRISWKEALDEAASRLKEARKESGPHSVLFYRGSGYSGLSNDISASFWRSFGGATTTYGNLCWPAGLEAVRLTMGRVVHNVPWDLANARLIILWGKNPAETNVQEMIHIARARENGARVIVIDPRRTPTADKADLLIRPNPGTDAALALAVAGIIIENGRHDAGFIERHVHGFDAFRKSLTITADEASSITGIPTPAIVSLADEIGNSETLTVIAGYGLQRYTNGGQTIRAILSLAVIRGMIGKSGCGFNFASLQGYIFENVKEPLSYYPDPVSDKPFRRAISMARFGEDFFRLKDPGINVAWIERGNPLVQLPGSSQAEKALKSVPFIVVTDQFMTDTASIADLVLPAKGVFEQEDVIGSYWNPYVHYRPQVTGLQGEALPESTVYHELASRIMPGGFSEDDIPHPDSYGEWIDKKIRENGIVRKEDLILAPLIPPGSEFIAYSNLTFNTPSGRIELLSDYAAERWGVNTLPSYDKPDDFGEEDLPFRLMTPNIASRIHSQFGNLDVIRAVTGEPVWEMSPRDARTLDLKSGDLIRVFNSRGEVTGKVSVTNRVRNGSLVYPNGIWLSEGGGVNRLVEPAETDMGYGAAFHNTRVAIEKAG